MSLNVALNNIILIRGTCTRCFALHQGRASSPGDSGPETSLVCMLRSPEGALSMTWPGHSRQQLGSARHVLLDGAASTIWALRATAGGPADCRHDAGQRIPYKIRKRGHPLPCFASLRFAVFAPLFCPLFTLFATSFAGLFPCSVTRSEAFAL